MDKNERKKKMRKGLLIVGIVIAAEVVMYALRLWAAR